MVLDSTSQLALLAASLESLPEPVFMKDRQHRWIAFNAAFSQLIGRSREELIGRTDHDIFPRAQADRNWAIDDAIFSTGRPNRAETPIPLPGGGTKLVWTRKYLTHTSAGEAIFAITTDVTALTDKLRTAARLEAEAERQAAVIEAQRELIDALSVPVLDVGDGVLLIPLVGVLTRERAERAIELILQRITQARASHVIFDVSGMSELDGEIILALLRAFAAVRLLGCRSIVVGISPASAQMLVGANAPLAGLTTAATVAQGLAMVRSEERRPRSWR